MYTARARARFERTFGPWMGDRDPTGLARLDLGPITALGLESNRSNRITSRGRVPEAQLRALARLLPTLAGRTVILAIHYPPVDHRGTPYTAPLHGLINAPALIDLIARSPVRPRLVACGHVHRGFVVPLPLPDGDPVHVANCGSSGYAARPGSDRRAAVGVYEIGADGAFTFERHVHDGARFVRENDRPPPAA